MSDSARLHATRGSKSSQSSGMCEATELGAVHAPQQPVLRRRPDTAGQGARWGTQLLLTVPFKAVALCGLWTAQENPQFCCL